jgi:hypothetical protein
MWNRGIAKHAIFGLSLLGLMGTLSFMCIAAVSDNFPHRWDWNTSQNASDAMIISATEITIARARPLGSGYIIANNMYGPAARNIVYRFGVGSYQNQPYAIKTPQGTWLTYTLTEYSLATWPFPVIFMLSPTARVIRRVRRSLRIENGHCPFCGYNLQFQNSRCSECGRETQFF